MVTSVSWVPLALAAIIQLPGATTSGLSLPSAVGPLLEKSVMTSFLSTAPTVMTLLAAAGEPTVYLSGPLFPAATQTTMPASQALLTAWLRESVPSELWLEPRERLMTLMLYLCCVQVSVAQLQFEDGKMIKASKYGQAEENVDVEFTAEEQTMVDSVKVRFCLFVVLLPSNV